MKIKASKIVALLLALVLVFGSVAIVSSAATSDPYVKVSSISNVAPGSEKQQITISLSKDTEISPCIMEFSVPTGKIENVSVDVPSSLEASCSTDFNPATGVIKLHFTAAVKNADLEKEMALATVTFDFAAGVKGLVEITANVASNAATINGKDFGISQFKGVEADSVYKDMCGIGLKGYVYESTETGKLDSVNVLVELVMLDGSTVNLEAIKVSSAAHGNAVMTEDEVKKFIDTNSAKIDAAVKDKSLSFEDFDFVADTILLNGEKIKEDEKYDKKNTYTYTVSLEQLPPVMATIKVFFRPALENTELYHSSDIEPAVIEFQARAGKTVLSQSAILQYFKDYADAYNQLDGKLDVDNDGYENIAVLGVQLNQHIKDESDGKYDFGDFVLNEEYVAFNGSKLKGDEKYSKNEAENEYMVFFDQVNVPATILGTAAEAFGKLDVYKQLASANVNLINETIGAFQAFCDSLVNAEWPEAEDVEDEDGDDSSSPKTGSSVALGSALVIALALTTTAAVIIKKKED